MTMQPSPYPRINTLLNELVENIQAIFGDEIVGIYLHGSLVVGDFSPEYSDLDLVVALVDDVNEETFVRLDTMQKRFIAAHPEWDNRLDIDYISTEGLQTFKTKTTRMAVITPGDGFSLIDAGKDWLLSWYPIREMSVTLFGKPPKEIIAPISKEEFVAEVIAHVQGWREWVYDDARWLPQSYLRLLLCRAMYTVQTGGGQTSKIQAGHWAAKAYPDHATIINDGIRYRPPADEATADYQARLPDTRRFYDFVLGEIQK